jgi:hypothetical protein
VKSAYDSIDDLNRTLPLLKAALDSDELDEEKIKYLEEPYLAKGV